MGESLERERMVANQIESRGIRDSRLLAAFRRIPRHLFVPDAYRQQAYEDHPIPIGNEQTISQPLMVALMTDLLHLQGTEKVLEIGTGSGYQTAILAELSSSVVSIERHAALATTARRLLTQLGYSNISIYSGDGSVGLMEQAPYDCIIVTAASPRMPQALLEQLGSPGRMVIPIGGSRVQMLNLATKLENGELAVEHHGNCVFVPLIGAQGWG